MALLLVSVRDVEEALEAVKGGADIVDVKNPLEGSLRAAFPWIISEIRNLLPSFPLSATIGDFPSLPGSASLACLGALQAGADFVKVGLKGPRTREEALSLLKAVVRTVDFWGKGEAVACAYGDFERAGTLDPFLLPELAAEAGARVVMLDTAVKDGKPLLSFLSLSELEEFSEKAHSMGLLVALSGSLGEREIEKLKGLADVIGVRGAVCPSGRGGKLSPELVGRLKGLLKDPR
ncbi:MAG: hypothetical protein DSO03_07275 [Hadesarchaea archaeon]|nr:MAG: hypothetical protein DSO03_07275 [Hadesarchaea archaeon]